MQYVFLVLAYLAEIFGGCSIIWIGIRFIMDFDMTLLKTVGMLILSIGVFVISAISMSVIMMIKKICYYDDYCDEDEEVLYEDNLSDDDYNDIMKSLTDYYDRYYMLNSHGEESKDKDTEKEDKSE